eukprot:CAMPEP_0116019558 /NCGR_PEP_ID=MMETSP0321-20121206/9303_1 /TAXON_ID=163516 /ORGANISM="Leptocylindrus danicus var. danicus, Strain B650" /LENGTH=736 /DNA_ID=CAMNT_0003490141 /DNA_START=132 /DNA_END=2342 /DNA_ORIENTATION=+
MTMLENKKTLSQVGGGVPLDQNGSATSSPASKRAKTTCATNTESNTNPLLSDWSSQPFHIPPFADIKAEHFQPAFEVSMKEHMDELQAIVDNADEPTFDNVLLPYDRAGHLLGRVSHVFGTLSSSMNTDEIKKLDKEMSPILSRHTSSAYHLPGLFDKIKAVYDQREDAALNLTDEQKRLVKVVYDNFTRKGANFSEEQKKEYAELLAELSSLHVAFGQNVLVDEETFEMVLKLEDMVGCPDSFIAAAKTAAQERNKADDEYVLTLSRTFVEPFLTYADRRDLRESLFKSWTQRGQLHPDRNNVKIAVDILKLRQKQAEFFGCKNYAEWQLKDRMANTVEKVSNLLNDVWPRAKEAANKERVQMEEFIRRNSSNSTDGDAGLDGGIQPWDWRYYAQKANSDVDVTAELKPYLSREAVFQMATDVSSKLYNLKYVERPDIVSWHPDVVTYEVRDATTDELVAIFMKDDYTRQYKSSGAWMSEVRSQNGNLPAGMDAIEGIPIVTNNNNIAKADPSLLSFDEGTTLFHELGHGHHGMLSKTTYATLASTNVATDFVELQSQLLENWLEQPVVLKQAKHYQTGEALPEELLQKYKATLKLNAGFDTVEYLSCAIFDIELHQIEDYSDFDLLEFEKKELERIGMPQGIVLRHRPPSFQHLFASSHYSAGYYSYLWSDVLAADAFGAFTESGDIFSKEVADKARKYIYSSGNTVAPDELFRRFRGRDPDVQFMLKRKGLVD